MWIEIQAGPPASGRLQGRFGYALPLIGVVIEGNKVRFPMPAEERSANPSQFSALPEGESLSGEIVNPDGSRIRISGLRAPSLSRSHSPEWGAPVDLLGSGLGGWRPEDPDGKHSGASPMVSCELQSGHQPHHPRCVHRLQAAHRGERPDQGQQRDLPAGPPRGAGLGRLRRESDSKRMGGIWAGDAARAPHAARANGRHSTSR
jgi:hypothetical protein